MIWKITKKISGVFLIILGIIGLFLPILQGILLIIAGLTLLENQRLKNLFLKIKNTMRHRTITGAVYFSDKNKALKTRKRKKIHTK